MINAIINLRKGFLSFVIVITVLLFVNSCKTTSTTVVDTKGAVVSKERNDILKDVLNAGLKFKTLEAKSSLELLSEQANRSMKTNCYVKLIYNEQIQLSVRIPFINTEAFRFNLTPDSIMIIDRMSKRYAIESFQEITNKHDIDFNFYNLQALFTNSLFIPGSKNVDKKDLKNFIINQEAGLYTITTQNSTTNNKSSFIVNSTDRIQETRISDYNRQFNTTWQYSDFVKNMSGDIYPTNIKTNISLKNKSINFNISYTELNLNTDLTIDNQAPKKYQQCSMREILSSYLK